MPRSRSLVVVAVFAMTGSLSCGAKDTVILPVLTLEAVAVQGNLLTPVSTTDKSATIYVAEGSKLRFVAKGTSTGRSLKAVELTVSQGGQQVASAGPPGLAVDAAELTRIAPDCVPTLPSGKDCYFPAMVTISAAGGSATVVATLTANDGFTQQITAVYTPIDASNAGSANPASLPSAKGACASTPLVIALKPSYYFDNRGLKLTKASFFFSATYSGPNPGDPPCTTPPTGVSAKVGPVDVLYGAAEEAEIPGYVYVGNIFALGRWHIEGYSPEVGVTVTCDRTFGNSGIVILKTKFPTSVINGSPGMCY